MGCGVRKTRCTPRNKPLTKLYKLNKINMAESVTLKAVYRDPVKTRFGEGVRISIYTMEHPDVKMSSFAKGLEGWNAGDKVMIDIIKNGEYTNFKPADSKTGLEARVDRIEKHLGLGQHSTKVATPDVVPEQQGEFNDF